MSSKNGQNKNSMPLWLVVIVLIYLASLSTYAIFSGKKVKISFLPPSIETGDGSESKDQKVGSKIELWTVKGVLDIKSYNNLQPQLQEHVHELLLRIKPPDFEVDADGHFTIRNVPLTIEGEQTEPLLEVYPVREIFSQGYRPITVRLGQQQSSFGGVYSGRIVFSDTTKTIQIMDKLSVTNPLKESPSPYPSANATQPNQVQ